MLEQEVTDYLGRDHYERRQEEQEHLGCRNGYRSAYMDTAEGRVEVQVPQVRESTETYRSTLVDFLRGNPGPWTASSAGCPSRTGSDVLEGLALEM